MRWGLARLSRWAYSMNSCIVQSLLFCIWVLWDILVVYINMNRLTNLPILREWVSIFSCTLMQAIAIACCFKDEGSILIVCPAVLRYSWAEELERWDPSFMPKDIHIGMRHLSFCRCEIWFLSHLRYIVWSHIMYRNPLSSLLALDSGLNSKVYCICFSVIIYR